MVSAKILFALAQLCVLGLIAATVFRHWTSRAKNKQSGFAVTEAELWSKKKTELEQGSLKTNPEQMGVYHSSEKKPLEESLQIGTAIPLWPTDTAPHRVLGLPPDASKQAIEKAYKALMKNYHPDRFASWGSDYQKRANDYVLLLQRSREEMLKELKRRS